MLPPNNRIVLTKMIKNTSMTPHTGIKPNATKNIKINILIITDFFQMSNITIP